MSDYIRFERWARYHAVYARFEGRWALTFCAVIVIPAQVKDRSAAPPAVCRCCQRRMLNQYLIPEVLLRVKAALDA